MDNGKNLYTRLVLKKDSDDNTVAIYTKMFKVKILKPPYLIILEIKLITLSGKTRFFPKLFF